MIMQLVRGRAHVSAFAGGTVATIGNFDGVHLGHQALLSQLKREATKRQLPLVILLFEPQPAEFFLKQNAPARLSSLREKLDIIAKCEVDYVYCLQFNKNLANMSPVDFANSYFFSLLQVRYLLIGEDFRFGRARLGDVQLLKEMSTRANCLIETFPDFAITNRRVSSTKIREALASGQLAYSATLLGRTFSFCGRVIAGAGRGRQWGIPTANLNMRRLALPLNGVFCVQVRRQNGALVNGVANLGRRPTVDGTKNVLEIHLFDFNDTLYGERLQVYFLHKLRDEIKFPSPEDLIRQIHDDIAQAKAEFKSDRFRLNNYLAHS
jgi:riboflavin kinase / FMN adenylyltransferase